MAACWCSWWPSRRAALPGWSPAFAAFSGRSTRRRRRQPPRSATVAEPVLQVENVSKRFGGLLAVDKASFTADKGRITALIGPNGAGKTTLFSIISGFAAPTEGRIRYRGTDITGQPPHLLARQGIARTFQIVQPFAGLTVRENIAVGSHLYRAGRIEALSAAKE